MRGLEAEAGCPCRVEHLVGLARAVIGVAVEASGKARGGRTGRWACDQRQRREVRHGGPEGRRSAIAAGKAETGVWLKGERHGKKRRGRRKAVVGRSEGDSIGRLLAHLSLVT